MRRTILLGRASSGKTTRLLGDFRAELLSAKRGGGGSSVVWIGPNARLLADVRSRLLDETLPAVASPGIHTLGSLANRIVDQTSALAAALLTPPDPRLLTPVPSNRPAWLVSPGERRRLVKRVVERGLAEGRLPYHRAIAETPGFVSLVLGTIVECKRLAAWPEVLSKHLDRTPRTNEIVWLYDTYQQQLAEHHLFDSEGRLWWAAEQVTGNERALPGLRAVFVDGFSDLNRVELQFLCALAQRAERFVLTLPDSPDDSRADVFAGPRRLISELTARWGSTVEVITAPPGPPRPLALRRAQEGVFDLLADSPDDAAESTPPACSLTISSGVTQEIELLARQIKCLLADATAPVPPGERVPPGEIVVVFRSLTDLAPRVREIFSRFGIPFVVDHQPLLNTVPAITALMGWLRLAVDDWPFHRLLELLGHNSLQPPWESWRDGAAAQSAERWIRQYQLPHGALPLLKRLERQAAVPIRDDLSPAWQRRRERDVEEARGALSLLQDLQRCLANLPERARVPAWQTALRVLAEELGFAKQMVASPEDRSAWEAWLDALGELDVLAGYVGEPPRELTLREVLSELSELAATTPRPMRQEEFGRVRVLGALAARGLHARHVFLAGLGEKSFPLAALAPSLLTDADRDHLAAAGLPAATRSHRTENELLLFQEMLARPTQRLWLSYSGLDAKAQPMSPSPYLVELQRVMGRWLSREERLDLTPVAHVDPPLCEADVRRRAIHRLIVSDDGLPLAARFRDVAAQPNAATLCAGLQVVAERSRMDRFGAFEGMLLSPAAIARMRERFGETKVWSATALELLAKCPFRYFAQRVLRIEPSAELDLETDHAQRGMVLHAVLAEFHRGLNAAAGRMVSPVEWSGDEVVAKLTSLLDEQLARAKYESNVERTLGDVDRQQFIEWFENYRAQHRLYDERFSGAARKSKGKTDADGSGATTPRITAPPRPAFFEESFGPLTEDVDGEEALMPLAASAHPEPLVIEQQGKRLLLRGRIDRIDVGQLGDEVVFNLLDYKSGSYIDKPSLEKLSKGKAFQLYVYAWAAEQLFARGALRLPFASSDGVVAARPHFAGYWQIKANGVGTRSQAPKMYEGPRGSESADDYRELFALLFERVLRQVEAARSGEFPVYSGDNNCSNYCEFRTICRVKQIESLGKVWEPPPLSEAASPPPAKSAEGIP